MKLGILSIVGLIGVGHGVVVAAAQPAEKTRAQEVQELIGQLDDKNPVSRYQAARSIILMGAEAKTAIPKLIEKLQSDKDQPARAAYAEALGIIGPETKAVLPALIKAFDDESGYVRYSAATALARFGPKAKPAVPALVAKFQTSTGTDREILAGTFGKIGTAASVAIPVLENALSDSDPFQRIAVAAALMRIDPRSEKPVPVLGEVLSHTDAKARGDAADALADLGPIAKAAVPQLAKSLKDETSLVRRNSLRALGEMESASAVVVPEILKLLATDEDSLVREFAATALPKISTADNTIPAALAQVLKKVEEKPEVRMAAALAMVPYAKHAEHQIPVLVETLGDMEIEIAGAMAQTLGKMGPPAMAALLEAKDSKSTVVRQYTMTALGILAVHHPKTTDQVLAQLTLGMKDSAWQVRRSAIRGIEGLGTKAKPAIPAMQDAQRDPNRFVRRSANEALLKINSEE